MNDPVILGVGGALIAGLFTVLWYFVQKFIKRTEENDTQLVETLDNLNETMNEINTNLLVFRTSTTDEFRQIHESMEGIKKNSEGHSKAIDDLNIRVKVIETHHNRNHPDDKL
jgi:uncharacterized protein YoxC